MRARLPRVGHRGLALLLLVSCAPSGSPPSLRAQFSEGDWQITVDQALAPGIVVDFPSHPLPDSAYAAFESAAPIGLRVSAGGERIEILDPNLIGTRQAEAGDRLQYDLSEGTFAGGRLVVWRGVRGLRAEITIYGSGVPIVRSERGVLTKIN